MAIQYQDNTFSETGEARKMLQRFTEEFEMGLPVKAFHVGSRFQIEKAKENVNLSKRIDELEERIKDSKPISSDIIIFPSTKEIKIFTAKESK